MTAKEPKRTPKKAPADRPHVAPAALGLPQWVPAAIFIALTLLLFREFVFSDRMLFGGDTLGLGYVARAFYAETLTQLHTFPRWNPEILGGTPFIEALSGGDSLYPPSLLLLLLMEPYRALGWKLVIHFAAAGFFMFGWTRALGASRPAALVGGTAYMLAPYFVSLVHPGHDGKIFVTALAPLLFWAVERHFQRSTLRTFTNVALVVGLVIFTTHFQMAYFLFGSVGIYAMVRAAGIWRDGSREDVAVAELPATPVRVAGTRFGLFLAASVAGAGVAAVQLLPALEYVTEYSRRVQTTRETAQESGVEWSSSWSLHPEEVVAMVIPEFAGNNAGGADWSQGTYWGRNATKDNHEGAGVVVLALALVGVLGGQRRRERWYLAGLATLALLFALGSHTPIWRIFYEVVPGIRLFRAPSQVMFLFALSASTLAALGVDRILSTIPEERASPSVQRALWIAAGALGLLALLAASGGLTTLWTTGFYADADAGRLQRLSALQPFIARGAWTSFGLVLTTAALVWAARSRRVPAAALVGLLVFLVAVDEFRVSSGFIQTLDFQQWSAPDPNMQAILERERGSTEPYRLLSFAQRGQDVHPAMYGIELAGGHHPNDLSRYRELIGMVGSGLPVNLQDTDIRRLLNVRYVLWPDYEFGEISGMPLVARTALGDGRPYESVLADDGLPRARLVGGATVKSDVEAVPYMLSNAFDPEGEVVLPEPSPITLDGRPATGTVTWQSRSPNELRLHVTTERNALLVIADNWFPAWLATVDGAEAPVLRAYHTLRAVPVAAGDHDVVMWYRSTSVTLSVWISLLSFLALLAVTGLTTWRGRQARRDA